MKKKIVISIIACAIISFIFLFKFGKKYNEKIGLYSKSLLESYMSSISEIILKKELLKTNEDEMFKVYKNSSGEIISIDFNDKEVNKKLIHGNEILKKSIVKLENGSMHEFENNFLKNNNKLLLVPINSIYNNAFFTNIGPKIPVKIETIGSIKSNAIIRVFDYGINNSKIDVVLLFETKEKVLLPIQSRDITLKIEIPLASKIIQGKVPSIYSNSLEKKSKIYSRNIEN